VADHFTRERERLQFVVTDKCFDTCVSNFRSRILDAKERHCLDTCITKYVRLHGKSAAIFEDQTLLQAAAKMQQVVGPTS